MQYHDEHMGNIRIEDKEKVEKILQSAIDRVNSELKLNVTLSISIKFGNAYDEIH